MIPLAEGLTDPVAAGIIGELQSTKLNKIAWAQDIIKDITSSQYFDDLKSGDRVIVPIEPVVPVHAYVEGDTLSPDRVVPSTTQLVIDQAVNWDVALGPGTRAMSYVDLLQVYAEGGRKSAQKRIHEEFFATFLPNKAAQANRGATAGAKTGNINLGTSQSPLVVSPANIVSTLLKADIVLRQQNLESEPFSIIIPSTLAWLYFASELKSAAVSGDEQSMLRTGYLGPLGGRAKLYVSDYVAGAGTTQSPFVVYAMTKQAVAYTMKIERTRLYEDANFDVRAQGLVIWGRAIVKDWALVQMCIAVDPQYAPST